MRILFYILMFMIAQAHAAEEFILVGEPDWINHLEIPGAEEVPREQIRDGVHYLLVDRQVKVPAVGESSFFSRYVTLIMNQAGLEQESQVNISFDPTYQRVQLHKLVVQRDGVLIDKLERSQIKVLDQEDELENQMYYGEKTINVLLDDIRVGDTIDYSYTIIGANPVMGDTFNASYELQWSVPVSRVMLRILWQKPVPLQSKINNSDLTLNQMLINGGIEYWVDSRDVKAKSEEDDTPSWINPYAAIYLSEDENWASVVDWGAGLFESVVKSEQAIVELADRFSNQGQSQPEIIADALQFVQSEIRYVGIELGENSHQASSAATTLNRRYGDCKDKVVLFITILRQKGIKAYPVLVNTSKKNSLLTSLPSRNAFNHAIVAVEHNDQTYWLDPTRQYQYGNLEHIYQPDYGQALVLNSTSTGLVSMSSEPKSSQITSDYFDLSDENREKVIFSSSTEYSGLNAERQLSYLESDGIELIRKDFLSFYQDYYSSIVNLEGPDYDADPERLRLLLKEKYLIKDFWQSNDEDKRYVGWVYSNAINSYLTKPDMASRTMDYKIKHPVSVNQHILLQLADKDWNFDNEEFSEVNEFFEYRSQVIYDETNRQLQINYSYTSKADYVPATDYKRYLKALEAARDNTNYGMYDYYQQSALPIQTDVEESWVVDNWVAIGLTLYGSVFVLALLLWYYDTRSKPYTGTMKYYPVSYAKFIAMWMLTWGLFPIYWFYKNWRYIKNNDPSSGMMPVFRGFFFLFWYYPLYTRLKTEIETDSSKPQTLTRNVAILFAAVFFIALVAASIESVYALPLELVAALMVLPLLNMINRANQANETAIAHNSSWRVRHYLLVMLFIPLSLFMMGSGIGLIPSESVVAGDRLMNQDIKFMQRKGILNPGDDVIYFYSDAMFNIREDGNGFSDRHVFSYWLDEQGNFNQEIVEFEQIDDIKVFWSKSFGENTIVEIYRPDKSKALLFLSSTDEKDKLFVKELMARWNKKTADVGEFDTKGLL